MSEKSQVMPHGDLKELAPGLWQVQGSMARMPLPRNMVVYKLEGGGLLIHSAIALDGKGMAQLESFGKPELMIVPNRMHRLDAGFYKARYPEIRVVCPENAREQVEKVVAVDEVVEGLKIPGVTPLQPQGVRPGELAYELTTSSGRALVFCDLLFNIPHEGGSGGWIGRLLGSTGFFGMTRIGRWLALKDRQIFRKWLEDLASDGEIAVISVAHGNAITENCNQRLKEAAARL